MKFLLDENAEYRLALYLKERGHDVKAIAYDFPHALIDEEVLAIAYREQRVLLTNDNSDFGELIFRYHLPHCGVIVFRLGDADVEAKQAKLEHVLSVHKNHLQRNYDFVFIDCPPALGWLTLNALTASDRVIVVVSPGYFEVEAIDQIAETIRETKADYNPNLELIGLLFTMTDQTINTSTSLSILKQMYPSILIPRQIPRNTDIRDAHYQHQDIFSFNPKAYAAIAYEKLIDELFLSQQPNV